VNPTSGQGDRSAAIAGDEKCHRFRAIKTSPCGSTIAPTFRFDFALVGARPRRLGQARADACCTSRWGVEDQENLNTLKETSVSKDTFQLLLIACLATGTLRAANDPFVGKWKLNPSKSTLTDLMKVEAAGANKYALIFSGTEGETILADGTDQPGLFGTTLSVTIVGPDTWKVVRKKDGRTLLTGIWKLSEDGMTLTDHYTENRSDGSTFSLDFVYKRTAGSSGFPGTWESTSEKVNSVYEFDIQPWEGDGLSFDTRAEHQTQNMRFNGKDYPNVGPNVPLGSASSGRRLDERTLEMTDKIKDKVVGTRQISLSPDHKTLTMTVYPAGQTMPNILVFDRE